MSIYRIHAAFLALVFEPNPGSSALDSANSDARSEFRGFRGFREVRNSRLPLYAFCSPHHQEIPASPWFC